MTLSFDQKLPAAARLNGAKAHFFETLQEAGAIWLRGQDDSMEFADDHQTILRWKSLSDQSIALPVAPNEGNAKRGAHAGRSGLKCEAAINCGFVIPKALSSALRFTMAVIYTPSPEGAAMTLLTMNSQGPKGKANAAYMFLSDDGDAFTVKDTSGALELVEPHREKTDQPRLAIVTLWGNRLALSKGLEAPVQIQGGMPAMKNAADLFIGCRSQRKGLQKTLGSSLIHEVMVWRDQSLLLGTTEKDAEMLAALRAYYLWEY